MKIILGESAFNPESQTLDYLSTYLNALNSVKGISCVRTINVHFLTNSFRL